MEKVDMDIPIEYSHEKFIDGSEPIIILGSNGSGKTRYGFKLAKWNNAEFIPALRVIALQDSIALRPIEQADQELRHQLINMQPWHMSGEISQLFTKLLSEDASSAINFRNNYRDTPEPENTNLMRLLEVWHRLFPGRQLTFPDYTPSVMLLNKQNSTPYPAQQMSDGERVALYLGARVLDARSGTIIIDEPEVHFHSRLSIQFWDELEKLRDDCRFIYITHDLSFARSRSGDKFLIVRPEQEPECVQLSHDIPREVAESILSAASFSVFAEKLIFCEGTESSYDQMLFRALFNDKSVAVIPVGSCKDVIRCATTFGNSHILSNVSAVGVIDCDYWSDNYLESLPNCISILPVHEVESLFCMESVCKLVSRHLGKEDEEILRLYSEFVDEAKQQFSGEHLMKQISERFKRRCEEQIRNAINRLSLKGTEEEIKKNHFISLSYDRWNDHPEAIFDEEKARIQNALGSSDSRLFLKYLPGKVYFPILVNKLGMKKDTYIDLIIRALKSSKDSNLYDLGIKLRETFLQVLSITN